MTDSREILKNLKHSFYLHYKSFGFWDKRTQHAYKLHKDTLIGNLKEGK
ncbi:hypothetical protein [Clostridium kluyveri]|uniref:Uncharacterized protein n=1 Tax=Clostridium kluyveri (strain ATCC 8527 / DSM 555 / NBRC 12016 / NCIMB 10680 / K1) TaxID=431943 RepID=A5F9N6_CLOK5|nr:hypothetical protein [Clostridium kluyveri]ABQ23626.1 hypothetical protein CKL_4027 [Clostridium kluyveri DSM 555]